MLAALLAALVALAATWAAPAGTQRAEEVIGSYRCEDPRQVVTALAADGYVCALPGA